MAKPIFTIGFPAEHYDQESLDNMSAGISKNMSDYYVICYTHKHEETEFQAFFEKDFDDVKFDELKEIVKQLCENGN